MVGIMQRVQHVSADQQARFSRFRRLRHTVLWRLDGPWGSPAWSTLDVIVKGAEGAPHLPGWPTGLMIATLASAGFVAEGPEICLDGACMYKVKQYGLTLEGHVALAESFVRDAGLWTDDDTAAMRKTARRRPKLT